jgi:hypothetical protein
MVSNSIGASNGLLRTAFDVLHRFEYQVGTSQNTASLLVSDSVELLIFIVGA